MQHTSPMLATLVLVLALALFFGAVACAFRLPPLFGYLVAGFVVSPHTPGVVAQAEFTATLAEVGGDSGEAIGSGGVLVTGSVVTVGEARGLLHGQARHGRQEEDRRA